jgi:hypothetical protein
VGQTPSYPAAHKGARLPAGRPTGKRVAELADQWAFALANLHATR